MATVRTHGLARQQPLLAPDSVVLEAEPGALPGRREPLGGPIARSRSAALERTERKYVASHGCTQQRDVRAGWQRDAVSRSVRRFACMEILLPALSIRPERRVKGQYISLKGLSPFYGRGKISNLSVRISFV